MLYERAKFFGGRGQQSLSEVTVNEKAYQLADHYTEFDHLHLCLQSLKYL
jgi:hypothetical protein